MLFSFVALLTRWRSLNLLLLGDGQAASLGLNVEREKLRLTVLATLSTSAAVAISGTIGFVGLVVPHLLRLVDRARPSAPAAGLHPGWGRPAGAGRPGGAHGARRRHPGRRGHRPDRGALLPLPAAAQSLLRVGPSVRVLAPSPRWWGCMTPLRLPAPRAGATVGPAGRGPRGPARRDGGAAGRQRLRQDDLLRLVTARSSLSTAWSRWRGARGGLDAGCAGAPGRGPAAAARTAGRLPGRGAGGDGSRAARAPAVRIDHR